MRRAGKPDAARLLADLAEAFSLAPEHLSVYEFIAEPETPLGRRVLSGELPAPDGREVPVEEGALIWVKTTAPDR